MRILRSKTRLPEASERSDQGTWGARRGQQSEFFLSRPAPAPNDVLGAHPNRIDPRHGLEFSVRSACTRKYNEGSLLQVATATEEGGSQILASTT